MNGKPRVEKDLLSCGSLLQVATHIADEADLDRLQQAGQRLKHGDVGTRNRLAGLFLGFDGDIGGDVLVTPPRVPRRICFAARRRQRLVCDRTWWRRRHVGRRSR
ncbi:hypothetical protein ACFY9A_34350 [Streptomyces rubradiris]|uniref:hypothetical protein n=1 Tax=Streptomyces rubradiris TaxID=285531 RepID=UPI0036ECD93C